MEQLCGIQGKHQHLLIMEADLLIIYMQVHLLPAQEQHIIGEYGSGMLMTILVHGLQLRHLRTHYLTSTLMDYK